MNEIQECALCRKDLYREDYSPSKWGTSGAYCKACQKAYNSGWRSRNPSRVKQYSMQGNAYRRDRNRAIVRDWLAEHSCIECGEANPLVLNFDHRPEFTGNRNAVNNMVATGAAVSTLEAEIAKCDVRCHNCMVAIRCHERGELLWRLPEETFDW